MRRFRFLAAAAALAALAASIVGASAQQPIQRVQVGILECRGGASVGFIVGSVTNLGCVLRAEGMPEDRYIATIRKVGLDLGITPPDSKAWNCGRGGDSSPSPRSCGQRTLSPRMLRRAPPQRRDARFWSAGPRV